jgi:hypothetical protein
MRVKVCEVSLIPLRAHFAEKRGANAKSHYRKNLSSSHATSLYRYVALTSQISTQSMTQDDGGLHPLVVGR